MHASPAAGVGFKPEHFRAAMACTAAGMWFEVHAENYMVDGGPRLAMLMALRERFPISVHGVGLSLAADQDPDPVHLSKLKKLIERVEPFAVSEHLAWSSWNGMWLPDLLPFPRTALMLQRIARNIEITQEVLQRQILVENPSLYVSLPYEFTEAEFLTKLVRRTGCGLLVDINNAYVTGCNLRMDPAEMLTALPADAVGEVHLAGHSPDEGGHGILIDTHAAPIAEEVWSLYASFMSRIGQRPTLIERDEDIPDFAELERESRRAYVVMRSLECESRHALAS